MRASGTASVPADTDAAEEHALSDHSGPKGGMCTERRQFGRRNPPAGTAVDKKIVVPEANL